MALKKWLRDNSAEQYFYALFSPPNPYSWLPNAWFHNPLPPSLFQFKGKMRTHKRRWLYNSDGFWEIPLSGNPPFCLHVHIFLETTRNKSASPPPRRHSLLVSQPPPPSLPFASRALPFTCGARSAVEKVVHTLFPPTPLFRFSKSSLPSPLFICVQEGWWWSVGKGGGSECIFRYFQCRLFWLLKSGSKWRCSLN